MSLIINGTNRVPKYEFDYDRIAGGPKYKFDYDSSVGGPKYEFD